MASTRLPWRALRPLLLAGAAATAWLAFSAPTANADSAADSGSLFGSINSSVSSITSTAATQANAVAAPRARPATAESNDLLPLTGTVDDFIEAVPIVNQIVPAGAVGAVTAPITTAADIIVAEAAHTALPAASDALAVLDPILEPVEEVLSGVESLPLPDGAAAPGSAVVPDISAFDGGFGTDVGPALGGRTNASPDSSGLLVASDSAASFPDACQGSARSSDAPAGSLESPGNSEASPGPHEFPAAPGSSSAASQSSGAGPGGSAWLSAFHLAVPLIGVFPVSGPLKNCPEPVSFDPGSSPD